MFTFPKPTLVVLNVSVCVAATPVPVKATIAGEFGALLTMVTLPLSVPAEVGENCTLKLVDWPAFRLKGSARVPVVKPVPATLTCVTVRDPVPLFVS